jgi:hypothetical protein
VTYAMSSIESWKESLSFIIACGGVGAFIDFIVGKRGQQKVRSWVEDWWLRFADVNLKNFGRQEARTAAQIIEHIFGKFFSARRVLSILAVIVICTGCWLVISRIRPWPSEGLTPIRFLLLQLPVFLIVFSVSISFTMYLCRLASRTLPERPYYSFIIYVLFAALQYASVEFFVMFQESVTRALSFYMFSFMGIGSLPLTFIIATSLSYVIKNAEFNIITRIIDGVSGAFVGFSGLLNYILFVISYFPILLRFTVFAAFLLSFILRPAQKFILLLIARTVESDKPIFTITFGGIAAFAKAVEEILAKF